MLERLFHGNNLFYSFMLFSFRRAYTTFLPFLGLFSFNLCTKTPIWSQTERLSRKKPGSLMLFRASSILCHKALHWMDFFFALNGFTKIISRPQLQEIKSSLECCTICRNHFYKIINGIYHIQLQSIGGRLAKPSMCIVINPVLCRDCLIKQTFCHQRHIWQT